MSMKPAILLTSFFLFCTVWGAEPLPDNYRKWLDAEVVYIISGQERAEFARLATDEERDAFIERFWKLRDTDPSTEESEFKKEHYDRIRYANERFYDGIPGWKSDRGRIWILHGPPDDIHYEYGAGSLGINITNPTEALTADGNADRRRLYRLALPRPETETWVYRSIDGAKNDTSYFQVMFSRTDPARLWELNQTLRHMTSSSNMNYGARLRRDQAIMIFMRGHFLGGPFRIIYAGEYMLQDIDDFFQGVFHPQGRPNLTISNFNAGLADLERPTGEGLMDKLARARKLKEDVQTRTFFQELPLTINTGTLQASAGSTILPLCLALTQRDLDGHLEAGKKDILDLVIELVGEKREVKASIIDSVEIERKKSSWEEKFLYQTRLGARPGTYRLLVYASLRNHPSSFNRELPVTLPDYSGNLVMSDLLLFERVVPKSEFSRARNRNAHIPHFLGRTEPVYLKDFVLIPSSDRRFRRGQKLTAFFEIYNALIPAGQKAPALEVSCRLKSSHGLVQELPARMLDYLTDADAHRSSYGISIPLLGFQTGSYSLEFEVHDSHLDKSTTRATNFTVY